MRERELESTTQSIPIESQSSENMIGDREGIQRAFLYVGKQPSGLKENGKIALLNHFVKLEI